MTQHEKISNYIDSHGSITPMDAFSALHITKLATRISEMVRDGYKIEKVCEITMNQDGVVSRYMRYRKVTEDA